MELYKNITFVLREMYLPRYRKTPTAFKVLDLHLHYLVNKSI